jgi:hypothetical protein
MVLVGIDGAYNDALRKWQHWRVICISLGNRDISLLRIGPKDCP